MPVPCDYIQIVGNKGQAIPQTAAGDEVPLPDFDTSGREPGTTALLAYSVRNVTGGAQVFINNNAVGTITATRGTGFSTHLMALTGSHLNDGNNKIALGNVASAFMIKNVICLFHQSQNFCQSHGSFGQPLPASIQDRDGCMPVLKEVRRLFPFLQGQ